MKHCGPTVTRSSMIAFLISLAKPIRVSLPIEVAPRIRARLPTRQSAPIVTGPWMKAPSQIRVRAPTKIGPRLVSSTAVSDTLALGWSSTPKPFATSSPKSHACACSSRHHTGIPRRLVAAIFAPGDQSLQAVAQPHRIGEDDVDERQRRHPQQPQLIVMEGADAAQDH